MLKNTPTIDNMEIIKIIFLLFLFSILYPKGNNINGINVIMYLAVHDTNPCHASNLP